VLYDLGTGLEVLSPLCPQFFLEMAGIGNLAKVHTFIEFLKLIYMVMVTFVVIQIGYNTSCLFSFMPMCMSEQETFLVRVKVIG